jgi:hypothetical protein
MSRAPGAVLAIVKIMNSGEVVKLVRAAIVAYLENHAGASMAECVKAGEAAIEEAGIGDGYPVADQALESLSYDGFVYIYPPDAVHIARYRIWPAQHRAWFVMNFPSSDQVSVGEQLAWVDSEPGRGYWKG